VIVDFSSPIFFWIFYVPWIVLRTLFVNRFQSILFYILHDICLVYVFVNLFFNVVFCVCSLFFFSLSTRSCKYYMNYWKHPLFNCWQNRPD
jgi:hypothetical protein